MQNIAYTQKVLRRNAKQGWLAYDFDSKNEIQVGLTKFCTVLLPIILTTGFS
jgi:hypothetical protein